MQDLLTDILKPAVLAALIGVVAAFVRYFIIKNNERKSINRALLSEISRLLGVIPAHRDWWVEAMKYGDTDLPLINFTTDVYDVILKNWGKIDPSCVALAARFYGYVLYLNRLQAARVNYPRGKEEKFNVSYLLTLDGLISKFNSKFDRVFKKFNVELPKYDKPIDSVVSNRQ